MPELNGSQEASHSACLAFDDENRPTTLTYGSNNRKAAYEYDGIGRISKRTVTAGGQAIETAYTFEDGGYATGSTTPLVKNILQNGKNTAYAYDDAGNIVSVDTPQNEVKVMGMFTAWLRDDTGKILYRKDAQGNTYPLYAFKKPGLESDESQVTYAYDKLGQLIRVNDPYDTASGQQGTTWLYEYDQGGSRREAPPVAE